MKLTYSFAGKIHTLWLDHASDPVALELDGKPARVSSVAGAGPRITFQYKDKPVNAFAIQSGDKRWVHVNGTTLVLKRTEAGSRHAHSGSLHQGTGSGIVVAPMPGQVRAVLVQEGDPVTEAQPLVLLEAMKMELKVLSPHDGIVSKISVVQGASVERDQILGEIEELA